MLVDSHCHVYSFRVDEMENFKDILIVGVAEDYESSIKNLELSTVFPNILPFAGFHPWNLLGKEGSDIKGREADMIIEVVERFRGIGEVGLSKKYSRESSGEQVQIFRLFCEIASEKNLPMNIHALDTWRECFDIVTSYSVKRVLFHWYTGPLNLLKEIASQGYYISINPAVIIQPKHAEVLKKAELDMVLTESDGPYIYHGKNLSPLNIHELIDYISKVKDAPPEYVEGVIEENFKKFIG